MNASAHEDGCDDHGWNAVRSIITCAALTTGMLTSPTLAADWSAAGEKPGLLASETTIGDEDTVTPPTARDAARTPPAAIAAVAPADEENALLPMDAPLAELAQAIEQDAVDFGFETAGGLPAPAESLDDGDMPLTEYVVADGSHPGRRCPRWTAQIDALLLWQTNIPSRPLYVDSVTEQTVLDANQAVPPVSAAPRYALFYHRDPCHAFEINYFQIQSFAGTAAVAPGANFYASDNLPGAPFADILAAQVNTSAGLKSWEFNLRRGQGGIVTWIGGFRWLEWNQQLGISDLNDGGATGIDTYAVNTGNNLYGGQLGADLLLWNASRAIKVNGLAKGGVYYNYQAYQNTTLGGDQSVAPDPDTLAASKDTVAFMGEVGLVGEYKIAEWLSWRAGYTLFWLGGIATPTNQLPLSDFTAQTTSINTYSSAFLHGVTTGLEARW